MPTEINMPRLGWDMKVGSVAEWLKREGDRVEAGEPICMIAGDKATVELEAPESGILRLSPGSPGEGVEVPVGTLLAYVVSAGEELPASNVSASNPVVASPGVSAPSTLAAERTVGTRRVIASPRARRVAAELGLDWRLLVGSGRGGRILERDVTGAGLQARARADTPQRASSVRLEFNGVRRLTAERLALSARTVAPVSLTTEADATTLVRLREQALAERHDDVERVPGYTPFMVRLAAIALGEQPALNASLTEDGIVQHHEINIGIAVQTEAGLLAPVVRGADAMSVQAIARESRRLIEAARSATIRAEDLAGATFTITNLGMYDVDAFTPIINLPQCAILGLGRIVARPVVIDENTDKIAVRRMLTLSLTFDHRLVDGAPAARFLQRIKRLVERPTLWLFR
jgi:pyruvate dehydrogenase E2 component (dihydrolipoamide acetyltransferase)